MQVWNSDLYGEGALDACEALVEQLSDVYRWQSNSEGALIFASKILFLLRDQNRHVSWFKQNLRPARRKKRATLICPMSQDILLTVTHDNKMLLPGGLIERSELAIVAAARELYEETGLIAQHLEFLFGLSGASSHRYAEGAERCCSSDLCFVWRDIREWRAQ
ncbi:NUDIX domain-containing protein [Pseudomonas aeruginosa]|nr:NUDIX domain-containing protein [Pseudomonas aeruginosa]HBO1619187.1 NUDIX domain-containing protein [Pseudomonas aeruginosa]HCT5053727.1 NUDIX domain-containing protein [Pseudomonas aeruginosa]